MNSLLLFTQGWDYQGLILFIFMYQIFYYFLSIFFNMYFGTTLYIKTFF